MVDMIYGIGELKRALVPRVAASELHGVWRVKTTLKPRGPVKLRAFISNA